MDNEWVQVRSCRWLHEAELLKSVLDAAGLEAFVPDENMLNVYGNVVGSARVLVRPDDLERANEILDSAAIPPDDSADADV